jgi:hypothetical protein
MEKLLKKGHFGVISQLHAIQATETPSVLQDVQSILSKHEVVFSTPQGIPPSHGVHDHSIPLVPGSLPPNIHPYHYPCSQKNEIEKMVQELLNVGIILPSMIPYLLAQGQTQGSKLQQHTNETLTTDPFGNTCKAYEVSPEVEVGVVVGLICLQP